MLPPMEDPDSAGSAVNVVIEYNGKTSSNGASTQFTYNTIGVPSVTSFSPTEASPVLKGVLTITGTNFGST